MDSREKGLLAEAQAEHILLPRYPVGTQVIARNWRLGSRREIDRVLWEPQERILVFVEVRFRTGALFGRYSGLESISFSKARSLQKAIQVYLARLSSRERLEYALQGIRVDLWWGAGREDWQLLRGLELPRHT